MQYDKGAVFDGRYLLKEFIGSGSFGEVWLAVDRQTDIEVAIKIYVAMDPQGLKDFIKEFSIALSAFIAGISIVRLRNWQQLFTIRDIWSEVKRDSCNCKF